MNTKIIYLVDDDEAVLTAMERLLRLEGYAVRSFNSAESFLKKFESTMTGCVVSDVRMPPGMTGIDLFVTLRKLQSSMPVIFLTGYSDVPAAVRAMKTGAVNFLIKPARITDLLSAIREAFELDESASPSLDAQENGQRASLQLSRRESEVINLVVAGESNKMIASLLGISPRTVEIHRANGMRKLGTNTLHGLMTTLAPQNTTPNSKNRTSAI
ncbi:response regulator transcription factor [Rhodoferax mekongensis]|uniref:Response regulator n=1 Tax=Rhodoferax mekongensis TaxID=3068341 RepID=A0ABZ0B373_9BURK|nr:response regulator [Rhodoferax sp. TBRC 17307]WNO06144.1 response regulator [Rhodoferax sp. TBRC 17307]